MNKKIIVLVVLLIAAVFILSSCGNRQSGIDTNQTFNRAYVLLDGMWEEVKVKVWRDFEKCDEVQIISQDGKVYLTHYSNVVLVNE